MKILAIYYMHKPGGFCKRLYALLNALSASGHQVYFLTLGGGHPGLSNQVTRVPIRFPLRARKGLLFWATFTVWSQIAVLLFCAAYRPSKMVIFGAYYAGITKCARRFFKIPATLFLRSLVFKIDQITGKPKWLRAVTENFERRGMRSVDHIVCMTESMKEELGRFAGKALGRVSVLPNNLPEQPKGFQRANADGLVLFTSGVLDQRKNIELVIDALALLGANSGFSLRVAGEGLLRSALESRVKECGLSSVTFLGWVEDVWCELSKADLVVHPSHHEGVSNSLLEALAAGCPVIASDIPEHRELLDRTLLTPASDPKALAALLTRFKDSAGFRGELCERSGLAAQRLRFDWQKRALELVLQ